MLEGTFNQEKAIGRDCKTLLTIAPCVARYLQQWVVAWNGYDGNIYITTALTLPHFQPPRILVAKQTEAQKNWYPNIIHKYLGTVYADIYTSL